MDHKSVTLGLNYQIHLHAGAAKDFLIQIPWGVVAGKTYGCPSDEPVICLHGWMDNCNTFNALLPFLPQGVVSCYLYKGSIIFFIHKPNAAYIVIACYADFNES